MHHYEQIYKQNFSQMSSGGRPRKGPVPTMSAGETITLLAPQNQFPVWGREARFPARPDPSLAPNRASFFPVVESA